MIAPLKRLMPGLRVQVPIFCLLCTRIFLKHPAVDLKPELCELSCKDAKTERLKGQYNLYISDASSYQRAT